MNSITVPLPGVVEAYYQAKGQPVPNGRGKLVIVFDHDAPAIDIETAHEAAESGLFCNAMSSIGLMRAEGLSVADIRRLLIPEHFTVERRQLYDN